MTQRFLLVLVAVVFYLAGMATTYAMLRARPPATPTVADAGPALPSDGPRNGFTGMEFNSAAHATMFVRHVVTGSPADKAGIKEGDHVVGLGSLMNPTVTDAIRIIEASRPGDVLTVYVQRGGHAVRKELVLMDHTEYVRLKEREHTRMLGTKRE